MYQYTLNLYLNKSEPNDLQKVITNQVAVTGYSRTEVDILNPVITLNTYQLHEHNYCYITELKRYYYIEDIKSLPNGTSELSLKVDVLMSYISDIKASHGLILKQRNYNPYFGENDVESRKTIEKFTFNDRFNYDGEYVLVALRGVGNG